MEDAITQKLITIFQIVSDWLKFAEAKNGVLFAFSGAGITAVLTYISALETNLPNPSCIFWGYLLSFLSLNRFISLLSVVLFLVFTENRSTTYYFHNRQFS